MLPQMEDFQTRMQRYRDVIAASSNLNAASPTANQLTITPTPLSSRLIQPMAGKQPAVQSDTMQPQGSGLAGGIIKTAESWKGVPYKWGGTSKKGVDCSGLTSQVAARNGINIPRTAAAQYSWFKKQGLTVSYKNARPGDYLYFKSSGPSGWHTAIYLGNGKILDAPRTGDVVGVHSIAGRQLIGVGRLPS